MDDDDDFGINDMKGKEVKKIAPEQETLVKQRQQREFDKAFKKPQARAGDADLDRVIGLNQETKVVLDGIDYDVREMDPELFLKWCESILPPIDHQQQILGKLKIEYLQTSTQRLQACEAIFQKYRNLYVNMPDRKKFEDTLN